MKRIVALFLVLMTILCGCAQEVPKDTTQPENSAPSVTDQETSTTPVTEPEGPSRPNFGLYKPNSATEQQTGGAVMYFPLDGTDYFAVEPMGDGLLLFSGTDVTTLTLLREEADPVMVTLDCFIYPDGSTLRICEDGIYYFDVATRQIVLLSQSLQEIDRTPVPEDLLATPVLSSDGKRAYYFSNSALRCFELDTGISRLLRDSRYTTQEIWGIHFDDTVLECFALDGGKNMCQFVSAQTGELLVEYEKVPEVDSGSSLYFSTYFEGSRVLYLVGNRGEKPQCLNLPDGQNTVRPLLEVGGVVAYEQNQFGVSLSFYNLERGQCSAKTPLYGVGIIDYFRADQNTGLIWLLANDSAAGQQALYCWDTTLSPSGDDASYLTTYYTAQEPDTKGLAQISARAKAMGEKYGVRIRVWQDAKKIQPSDYTFEAEHLVPAYEEYLPALEKTLKSFPEGFLQKLGKGSKNGVLTISLVRQLNGDNSLGSLSTATGVHFWHEGSGYIAVPVRKAEIDQNLFHELFHAIDSYVMGECTNYDNWPDLNPKEFFYDYSYVNNQFREDYQYLEDENRAFIDMYSMSYPKEDRARIFEYAMMDGNESYFQSEIMQLKLKTLCKGIREAFKLKKYTKPLLWEQYLK